MDCNRVLDALIGLPCTEVIAQAETGGDLLLHFGRRVPYDTASNPKLQTTDRGEYALFVQCPWRLDDGHAILTDWTDPPFNEAVWQPLRDRLERSSVVKVEMGCLGPDLIVVFEGGVILTVFASLRPLLDDSWFVLTPDGSAVAATEGGQLKVIGAGDNS